MSNSFSPEDFIIHYKMLQFSKISRRISVVARGLCARTDSVSWELIAGESRTDSAHALLGVPMGDCSLVVVWAGGPLVPLECSQVLQHEAVFCWTLMCLERNGENCFQENSKDCAAYRPLLETGYPTQILDLVGMLGSAWKRNQFCLFTGCSIIMVWTVNVPIRFGSITYLSYPYSHSSPWFHKQDRRTTHRQNTIPYKVEELSLSNSR
jgi:hypothetical protein